MTDFNQVFSQQMNQISNDTITLNGGVERTIMPEKIENDPELKSDLKLLGNDGAGKVANDFKSALSNSLNELNGTQRNAEVALETFATGGDIDVHQVMIAQQKASLGMSMAMQLRNKALQAYNDIYKMGV
jgi:flagellar hook-basal body complex protein FliE